MPLCILCKNNAETGKPLRNGSLCCHQCFHPSISQMEDLYRSIAKLEQALPPLNLWHYLWFATGALTLIVAVLLLFALSSGQHYLIFWGLLYIEFIAVIAINTWAKKVFSPLSKKRNDKFRNTAKMKIAELYKDPFYLKMSPVYDQLWELPPDWEIRRKQVIERDKSTCQKCGTYVKSGHVHHIVPKAKHEGNHSLANLRLLCAECHSHIESVGHSLIRGNLYPKKHRRRRR